MKLVIRKPGPMPSWGLVRYTVVNGRPGARVELPLPITAQNDTMFRVSLVVKEDIFVTSIQGQVVDHFSDKRFPKGGVGFFSSEGEPAWSWGDDKIAGRAVAEIERIGWLSKGQVIGSWVLRVPCAYPLYRIGYAERVGEVRSFLQRYPGLMLVGRTGAFKYLNSDGVIEDCLKLLCELVPESAVRVRRLRDAGRWV